ncbi:MAG: Protein up-regulated by thyroid hormone-putative PQQ-dependent glucose dehydrogenase, partial [Bacteroidetes bacterium]|nr:Protein up-regulated by thyroid hormone-putative PQQ-dependent glucose dehydrogenase [Bacteroidota bacterium]
MSRICLIAVVMLMCLSPVVRSQPLTLVNAYPNLTFTKPVLLIAAPDGTDRVFVVQQNGVIRVFPNDSTVSETKSFLDIGSRLNSSANEQGL